jgi:hypothetical protein
MPADPPSLQPDAIAQEATTQQQDEALRESIRGGLDREIDRNRNAGQQQYEQAVLWRRINLWIGLIVGALVAASGTTGLVAKNGEAAAVIAALATFGAGALTTLNAGQKKTQAAAAGATYRELESEARQLRDIELPFAPLGDALAKLDAITASRMSINRIADPPSARAFRRVDRNQQERVEYGRILTFAERHKLAFWAPNAAKQPVGNSGSTDVVPPIVKSVQ